MEGGREVGITLLEREEGPAGDVHLDAGLRVVTMAPDGPRSGGSRGATFRRPVRFDQVNNDATNLALQVALLIPLLAGLLGLFSAMRMMRLPDIEPSTSTEAAALA